MLIIWIAQLVKFIQDRIDVVKKRNQWPSYTLDTEGFTQTSGESTGKKVSWSKLEHVGIVTTEDGPFFDDFFYIFKFTDDNIVLTLEQATEMKVFDYFQTLPNFNWESTIKAAGSCVDASFPCWDVSWSQ